MVHSPHLSTKVLYAASAVSTKAKVNKVLAVAARAVRDWKTIPILDLYCLQSEYNFKADLGL